LTELREGLEVIDSPIDSATIASGCSWVEVGWMGGVHLGGNLHRNSHLCVYGIKQKIQKYILYIIKWN